MTVPTVGSVAAQINLLINQKAAYHAQFAWQINGVAQSLAGYTAVLGIAAKKGKAPLVSASTTIGDGITLEPGQETGVIQVDLTAAETTLLVKPLYYYDLLVIDGTGDPSRLFEGQVTVDLGIASVP